MLADGAGVEDDEVCFLGILGKGEAARFQHAHELLTVSHVLLAAEGVDAGAGMCLAGGKEVGDLFFKLLLALQLFSADQYIFTFQWEFLRNLIVSLF